MFLAPLALAGIAYLVFVGIRTKKKADKSSRLSIVYRELMQLLSSGASALELKTGTRSVKLSFVLAKEKHSYHFSEVDNRLIIVWTLESKQHGKRGKEWSFSTGFDQKLMFNEIKEDLGVYNRVLHREQ
jgi:hypothetical protein